MDRPWRDPAGKQRKKSFARKVEAQRWLDQLQSEMHRGSYIDPSGGKTLVATYAQRWRDNLTHLKPSTLERYKGIVHTHILRSGAAGKRQDHRKRCQRLDINTGC